MSLAAYKRTIRESETPRQIERRILSRVTHNLTQRGQGYDATDDTKERLAILAGGLRDALSENQQFWAALRYDLAEPANAMPDTLKASLISIGLWVDRQTSALMMGQGRLASLIEVNANIAAGLSGQAAPTVREV